MWKCNALFLVIGVAAALPIVTAQSAEDACIQCDSEVDLNCVINADVMLGRRCTIPSNHTCYSMVTDGRTVRGCASDLDQATRDNCRNETHCELCRSVNGRNSCNNNVFPSHRLFCHTCFGEANTTCAQEILDIAAPCAIFNPTDQCFIRRTGDIIRRGCVSSDNVCRTPGICYLCDGHGCNFLDSTNVHLPDSPASATTSAVTVLLMAAAVVATNMFTDLF